MKEQKDQKQNMKNKGITLIALVVTIVVLLILAAVSIGMLAGENGIIRQAQEAKEKTDIGDEKERVQLAATAAAGKDGWGEITEENLANELTKNIGERDTDYTLDKDGEDFIVTYTDSERSYYVDANGNIGEVVKREGLKVGDYVDYKPTPNTTGYTSDKLTSAITGSSSNTSTITQDSQYAEAGTGMTWQILRIYANGSIDLIGSPTSQSVYFQGATGYNNGVTVMNDICEELYSNENLNVKARSVRYEDLEYWLTDEGKAVRNGHSSYPGGPTYGHTQTYTSNLRYPNLYAQEKGAKIDSGLSGLTAGIDKETGSTTGLGISDEGTASGSTQASSSLTVTQTYWYGAMSTDNFGEGANILKTTNTYWLASRYAICFSGDANFGLRNVSSSYLNCNRMVISDGRAGNYDNCLRPVVSLPSSVQIENCTGINGVGNMHKITQY